MQTSYPTRILPAGFDLFHVEAMVGHTWRVVGWSRNRVTAGNIKEHAAMRLPMNIIGTCVRCRCSVKDKAEVFFSDPWVFCSRSCHDKYQMEEEIVRLMRKYPKRSFIWRLVMAWRLVRGSRASRNTAYKGLDAFT